ncbi:MAG: FliA/WhiG family RNA polymerase sigma factor, partial [Oscillospiraceae bacterium]
VKRIAQKTIGNYQYFNFLDDIVNEGIIALMDAVEKFDCRKNVKFETFASIKVKGAMIDFIRKQDCFPRRIKKIAKNIINAEGELSNDLNRNPTQQELASYMGVTIAELEKMQLEVYSLNIASFEQVVFETNSENVLSNVLTNSLDTPEQSLADQELAKILSKAISSLKEMEQMVISLHYKDQLKIKDIAKILEISDSRVSQIHSNALKRLKTVMNDYNNI